ncbi:MAG TPA: hypothetical protein PLQ28_01855 [Flexilinea sp.]|nr:hypothetical protein [Flexilinea sp.]HOW06549.1 hypothetical protein [Flexilinea sp.]HPG20306.1 hypothetical protein [Flexilinea sp.]
MKKIIYSLAMIIFCVQLAGCSGNEKVSEESKVVESFYNAIVNQERDKIGSIVCSDWEKDGLREVDAFMGVKSELKDFSCSVQKEAADNAEVTCTGSIAASYGNEITEFPLKDRIHKVVKENGEWRLCGFE